MDRSERFISAYLIAFFGTLGLLLAAVLLGRILTSWEGRVPGWAMVACVIGLPFWCLGWGYLGMRRAERPTRLFGRRTGARLAAMLGTPPSTRTHPRF